MFTFFRNIRKGLVGSGVTRMPASPIGRYLLYAIGEIALVVVGILIALQVNNWNESNKISLLEEEFIKNIRIDLAQDKMNLEDVISKANRKIEIFETIQEEMPDLYTSNPYRLDTLFISAFNPIPTFFPVIGTFNSESSNGEMGLFKNKKYISALHNLYTNYDRLSGNAEDLDNAWIIRYEKYKHARRVGSLGILTEAKISDLLDDIARCSKLLSYYTIQCNKIILELENLLALKQESK